MYLGGFKTLATKGLAVLSRIIRRRFTSDVSVYKHRSIVRSIGLSLIRFPILNHALCSHETVKAFEFMVPFLK